MRRIGNPNDFWAGLLFMSIGTAALVLSRSYAMGEAIRMGPGYFPRALGVLLLVFGAVLSLRAIRATREPLSAWRLRPLFIVLMSLAIFCLALKWLGLVVSGMVLIFVASLASSEFRWREALVSGAIQGAFAVVLFVYGLKIPLTVWPVFIAGGQ
jgi:hypothetical protein